MVTGFIAGCLVGLAYTLCGINIIDGPGSAALIIISAMGAGAVATAFVHGRRSC